MYYYSSTGALTGQVPAHEPQPIQADWSITNLSSPSDMQPTGHSAAQAPHDIHASVILYAIYVTTFLICSLYLGYLKTNFSPVLDKKSKQAIT